MAVAPLDGPRGQRPCGEAVGIGVDLRPAQVDVGHATRLPRARGRRHRTAVARGRVNEAYVTAGTSDRPLPGRGDPEPTTSPASAAPAAGHRGRVGERRLHGRLGRARAGLTPQLTRRPGRPGGLPARSSWTGPRRHGRTPPAVPTRLERCRRCPPVGRSSMATPPGRGHGRGGVGLGGGQCGPAQPQGADERGAGGQVPQLELHLHHLLSGSSSMTDPGPRTAGSSRADLGVVWGSAGLPPPPRRSAPLRWAANPCLAQDRQGGVRGPVGSDERGAAPSGGFPADPVAAARALAPIIEAGRDRMDAERRLAPPGRRRAAASSARCGWPCPRTLDGPEFDPITQVRDRGGAVPPRRLGRLVRDDRRRRQLRPRLPGARRGPPLVRRPRCLPGRPAGADRSGRSGSRAATGSTAGSASPAAAATPR